MMPKFLMAATLVMGLAIGSAAQAFTFEDGNGGKASTGASGTSPMRFGPGDSRFSTNSGTGTTSGQPGRASFGNGSIQFNSQSSFDQRYNSNQMFDSNSILGRDR